MPGLTIINTDDDAMTLSEAFRTSHDDPLVPPKVHLEPVYRIILDDLIKEFEQARLGHLAHYLKSYIAAYADDPFAFRFGRRRSSSSAADEDAMIGG